MVVEEDYSEETFGVCMGTPKVGIPCNDHETCTEDDKCVVVKTDDGDEMGMCMGSFAGPIPCNDYNDHCTSDDTCVLSWSCMVMTGPRDILVCWLGQRLSGPCCVVCYQSNMRNTS